MNLKRKSLPREVKGIEDKGFLSATEKDELFCILVAKLELIKQAIHNLSAILLFMILIELLQIGLSLLK